MHLPSTFIHTLLTFLQWIIIFYLLIAVAFFFLADSVLFQPPYASYKDTTPIFKIPLLKSNGHISAIYLANPQAKYTILFSHGNAEDLGTLLPFLKLFQQHGFAILAYDYQGYGTSDGKSSEKNTYQDIESAYHYLTKTLGLSSQNIIVYGRSIGSGPSIYLATQFPIRALILESPFVSAFRVQTALPLPFDKYPNLKQITKISVPLLVIHGNNDNVVPLWHGKKIFSAAKGPKQAYWVEGANHNNILQTAQNRYWQTLDSFITKIEQEPTS